MRRSTTTRSLISLAVAIALIAVLAILASGAAGGSPRPSPSGGPSAAPASPSADPSSSPTAEPTSAPSDGAGIPLDIATPHDVSVVVDDPDDLVADAASGEAGDGMSVRWFDVKVENVDADTLRVTWVGLPQDDVVRLTVSEGQDGIELRFVQASPPVNSDASGHDRVLVLDFQGDVDAASVTATVEHEADTQD